MVYIGQTTTSLNARLAVHNCHSRMDIGKTTSAYRLYRREGTLHIRELARIEKIEGETVAAFKIRLSRLEQQYIKGNDNAINANGKKYDRHDPSALTCQTCGKVFASCYNAAKHTDRKKACSRAAMQNAIQSIMSLPIDIFS